MARCIYKDIWAAAIWEVLVRSTEPTNVRKSFVLELYLRKIFSYVFCVRKYFYNKIKRITVDLIGCFITMYQLLLFCNPGSVLVQDL